MKLFFRIWGVLILALLVATSFGFLNPTTINGWVAMSFFVSIITAAAYYAFEEDDGEL